MARRKITKGTIYFYLKTDSKNSEYKNLMLRYSFQGKAKAISTGIKMLPLNWDSEEKEPIYIPKALAKTIAPDIKYTKFLSNNEVMDINAHLNDLELTIKGIESEITNISSEKVIGRLKSPDSQDKSIYFSEFMENYINSEKSKLKQSTVKVYGTMLSTIKNYERKIGRRYELSEVGYDYMKGVCDYMVSINLKNSTITRRLKHFKGFVSKARKRGLKIDTTYLDFQWKEEDREVDALTMDEFKAIQRLDLSDKPYLERVRDVFVFSCYTGLRYSDFSKLKRLHVKGDTIRLTTTKTRSTQSIPLSPPAKRLIEKYKSDSEHLFPVCSSQKFNEYIKIVGEMAGLTHSIEKVRFSGSKEIIETKPRYQYLSAHTARRTFVTLSLELGMKAEEIMPITGHRDYKSFKRYVDLTEKRAKEALLSAWTSLEDLES